MAVGIAEPQVRTTAWQQTKPRAQRQRQRQRSEAVAEAWGTDGAEQRVSHRHHGNNGGEKKGDPLI